MNRRCRQLLVTIVLIFTMMISVSPVVMASDDNSLASLGIRTEGVIVSPEFRYDIWEYSVEVPAGTKVLELEPHTTNPTATVNSVTGNELAEDGTGRVVITVTSESGNAIEYILNVTTARGDVDPAEAIAANESSVAATIDTEVVQSEVETEDPRFVKVDRNSLQDAENTIEKLQNTIMEQINHIRILTYVLYGLIAVSIIFLFIVISQLLRRRDMAQELAFYKQGDPGRDADGQIGEDGWGEWGEDETARSGKRKKKKGRKDEPAQDGWEDEPAEASSWTSQQVGTPVRASNHPARNMQYQAHNQAAQPSGSRQQMAGGQAVSGGQRQGMQPSGSMGADGRSFQRQGAPEETRRYDAVMPVRPQEVPKDVTKDLSRVNKAEAKAMKKAAAAQARQEQEARKAARTRAQEAQRQAQEAQRLEMEQEAARQAQEKALMEAKAQRARQEADASAKGQDSAPDGKNVKIDMIDL